MFVEFSEHSDEKRSDGRSYQIRYVKLNFTVAFLQDSIVPVSKASALRGGMGEMLLRANCIRDRKCESCDFEKECIVRRIMYSDMPIQPPFMQQGNSVGYVIECEDRREHFSAGEQMEFSVLLFGNTIVYFSQILNAFYALGQQGLGRENARFEIVSITNHLREPILEGYNVMMEKLGISTVADYISYRKRQIAKQPIEGKIRFKTPLSMKYQKEEVKQFSVEALMAGLQRRIYILNCYEGQETDLMEMTFGESGIPYPQMISEKHHDVSVRRYSNHQQTAMYLEGIEGEIVVDPESIIEDVLDLLLAGELVHVGKNTSFGFGRYRVK